MMNTRSIKVWFCVACLAASMAVPIPVPGPDSSPQVYLDIIDMAAISRMTPQQLETLAEGLAAEEIMRTKRSSVEALTSVVSKASAGLQSKLGLLGHASAFLSSASGKTEEHGYSYEPQHDEKYDYWGLKKSIFYTLLQAVKAITGGVTILKGQLIKGGGALASTLGKVIAGKGDIVSNFGKKIVSSAALPKKPIPVPVYGPPQPTHLDYAAPSAYGSPTAPAHYTHISPSLPTAFAAHKYPSQLDGRGKLNGLHAGLIVLTPLGEALPSETLETSNTGHSPLEPPPSLLHTVYSALKNAFSTGPATAPATAPAYIEEPMVHQPPPPPQPIPPFRPMTWGAVNSYGEPAGVDAYTDYDPRNPHPPFDYATSKKSIVPFKQGLTAEKLEKINRNLSKLTAYMNKDLERSSEDLPRFMGLDNYREMIKSGQVPLFPTPVVSDNEIGVLPAEFLPSDSDMTTSTTSSTTTTTTTTERPKTNTSESTNNRRTDFKYYLRGNRIIQV